MRFKWPKEQCEQSKAEGRPLFAMAIRHPTFEGEVYGCRTEDTVRACWVFSMCMTQGMSVMEAAAKAQESLDRKKTK